MVGCSEVPNFLQYLKLRGWATNGKRLLRFLDNWCEVGVLKAQLMGWRGGHSGQAREGRSRGLGGLLGRDRYRLVPIKGSMVIAAVCGRFDGCRVEMFACA